MIGLDWTVLALVAAAAVFAYLLKSHRPPAPFLWVPSTPLFTPTWKSRWSFLPQAFFIASLGLGALAALDPRWETLLSSETYTPPPTKGIALCLILDRSGSMTAKGRGGKSRIDQLKIQSQAFVKKRPQDLLGLIAFARSAEVLTPLTLDHQDLLHALQNLQVVPQKEQDGTAIGYAIYKGAEMMGAIQAFTGYTLKGMAMIVVTDGLQDPNPLDAGKRLRNMDIEEASDKAAEKGIHLYILNINPKLLDPQYAPNRKQLEQAAEKTGGRFFTLQEENQLGELLEAINRLEKSPLPQTRTYTQTATTPFYLPLAALSAACLLMFLLLNYTLLKRAP